MPDLTEDIEFQRSLIMGPHGRAIGVAGAVLIGWVALWVAVAAYLYFAR